MGSGDLGPLLSSRGLTDDVIRLLPQPLPTWSNLSVVVIASRSEVTKPLAEGCHALMDVSLSFPLSTPCRGGRRPRSPHVGEGDGDEDASRSEGVDEEERGREPIGRSY